MQAIILAAGMGKRLKEITKHNTKCMVKVNGVTLIERMLNQIEKHGFSRIIIVVGYEGQKLIDYIETLDIKTPIAYINNTRYANTNNIYSLALAKDWLVKEDTLILESDIIFEDSVLDVLLSDSSDTLALVDKYESWMDGTCVKINSEDYIVAFVPGKQFNFNEIDVYYKTVNLYKFSKSFSNTFYVPFLDAYQSALGENEYYEQVLRVITMLDEPVIKAKRLNGEKWYEIDDIQDLDIAESIFASDDERVRLFHQRYGGYWRYPGLLDYCYLVNPYFPPEKMKDELRSKFDTLLTEYPSGMKVNSLLAARNFGVHQDNIIVGNGAAELIKILMVFLEGKIGIVRPTFEEYPNRCKRERLVTFTPDNPNYSYTADDLINYFSDKDIKNLIVINPDNPSGNYIPKADLLHLIKWGAEKKIRLIIDESFADFADAEDSTIIEQSILASSPHLFVMKSISKSYGVPGLRLGVLASGDAQTIARMKKDVSIWNINSFAEFYMQIEEKYKKDYKAALVKIRAERERFQNELTKIKGVRVIPTQANFIMVELDNCINSSLLVARLLSCYNILVKKLDDKINRNNYLRLAIRDAKDNDFFLSAFKESVSSCSLEERI